MKILVWAPFRGEPSGGVAKHLYQLITSFREHADVSRVAVIAPRGLMSGLDTLGIQIVRTGPPRFGLSASADGLRSTEFDVGFSIVARKLPSMGVPVVTTVYNVEPLQPRVNYHVPLAWRLRLWGLRQENALACRQAAKVLAPSRYTKDLIERTLHTAAAKVQVVYPGFHPFERVDVRQPRLPFEKARFLFAAGSLVPYRGFEDLVSALGEIRKAGEDIPYAVLAGSAPLAGTYEQDLKALAQRVGCADRVVLVGQLNEPEMHWCYEHALAFVQCSRAESFSHTQVEALGHHCVMISCDQPPMPEVLGEGAAYYRTADPSSLAAQLKELLALSPEAIQARRAKAYERSCQFRWELCADQTLDTLKTVAAKSS